MFLVKSLGLLLCLLITLVNAGNTVIGYFPNFSSIPFSKYTHIHYAFAIMTEGNTPKWTDDANTETQLTDLVSNAHTSNTKVLISVGGWSGSITFRYNTDGVDIDWEYPGRQGAGCNVFDGSDITNYAILLQELRDTLDQEFEKGSKEISIAGDTIGFSGTSADITSIGQSVTRVNMMTYDINGAWNPQTGPNAPLQTSKGASFSSAIDTWTSLGVPANKLTGGLAFYGRSTTAKGDMSDGNMYQDQVQGAPPKGDSNDAPYQDPFCAKDPGGLSGIWSFNNMMSEGLLDTPLTAKEPWVRYWDEASSTPWLFNPQTKVFISYDDPKSIGIKANEAKSRGLDGIMIWSVNQDTSNNDLLSATGF
ncbi:glycoside hydrolase superfamily [Pilaira anomala]|nr:glycoside hydrolase superfamily [Pilaira anomala]